MSREREFDLGVELVICVVCFIVFISLILFLLVCLLGCISFSHPAVVFAAFLPRDALKCKARYWDCMPSCL